MAAVTITLGAPTTLTADFVQWQNRDAPVGLGDVSALSSGTGPRYMQRFRLYRAARSITGEFYLNFKGSVPDGTNAFDSGDDLSDAWEQHTAAVTLVAPNGTLTVGGPDSAGSSARDTVEPYFWSPPEASDFAANISPWITNYLAQSDADEALLTITLDGGVAPNRLALDAAPSTMGAMTSSTATVTIFDSKLALDAAPSTMGAMTVSAATVSIVDAHLALDAAPSTMGAMTASAATVQIRQAATTVELASNVDRPRATVTARTNRVDLFARENLGSDSDANIRDIIRWNVDYFRRRRTFWLGDGDVLFTAAP